MKRRKRENKDDEDNGFAAWGGYMEAKKSKLREQYSVQANNEIKESNIFSGISIFVNGYTKPSADELKQLMSLHGGIYHHYHIPGKTTYIIASNLPDTKIKNLSVNQKIIKPNWITDSINAGRIVDYRNYLLYTNQNRKQPRLNFEVINKDGTVSEQTLNQKAECKEQTTNEDVEKDTITEATENNNNEADICPMSPDIFGSYEEDDVCQQTNENNAIINNGIQDEIIFKVPEIVKNVPPQTKDKPSRTLTANDPKFLSEFYNNSRLHHIATLGATFKQHVCNLREQSDWKFPERENFKAYLNTNRQKNGSVHEMLKSSVIMHIDMDCFFVSVGLRTRPELRGVPVAVTHSKGGQEPSVRSGVDRQAELECYKQRIQERLKSKNLNQLGPGNMLLRLEGIENQSMSEIASCSYEARKAGVKNGMFMGTALKLCPNLHTIPYDFEGYKEVAYTLYNTIAEYTLNIEGVSCDEMFVDISKLLQDTGATVTEWATYIRALIQQRTGCPCSTGFGANRLQARMATRTAKPNGQFHLLPEAVEEYMVNISVDDLPGVGRSTSLKLSSLGVQSCGDLQAMTLAQLQTEFGNKIGDTLYKHCRGLDERQLVYEHERKSVSAEVNYGIRFTNNIEAETFLKQLAGEVHSRLLEVKMKGKCITLKLMVRSKDAPAESSKYMGHGICDYLTKSTTLTTAVNDLEIITKEVLAIANKLAVQPTELRGIGIQISRLEKQKTIAKSSALTKFLNSASIPAKQLNNNDSLQTEKTPNDLNKLLTATNISSKEQKDETNLSVQDLNNKIETNNKCEPISNTINSVNNDIAMNKNTNDNMILQTSETNAYNDTVNNREQNIVNKTKVTNQNQSTLIRGRGRPRGKGNRTIVRKKSNNGGNLDKFFAPPQTSNNIQERTTFGDIDMTVLAELPEDIRKEIMQQYKINAINNNKPTTSNNLNNKTATTTVNANTSNKITEPNIPNCTVTSETVAPTVENKNPENQCMFSGMDLRQFKRLVQEWVSTESIPEPCDVKILGEYLKQQALDKNITDLYVMLKFLYSEILDKNSCEWHRTYFEILNCAQEGMKAVYGSSIWAYKEFTNCENKCHLPNR